MPSRKFTTKRLTLQSDLYEELRQEAARRRISIETFIELLWTEDKLRTRQLSPMLEKPIALWTQAEEKKAHKVMRIFRTEDR
jgi:hypothetical protein